MKKKSITGKGINDIGAESGRYDGRKESKGGERNVRIVRAKADERKMEKKRKE